MLSANSNRVPRRIFLDTCTFQAISDCGGFIFDADDFPVPTDYPPGRCPQVVSRPDAREILEPLRWVFRFNERAHFDWIVSERSMREVDAGGNRRRSTYVRDIADHSIVCLSDNPPSEDAARAAINLAGPRLGFVSQKDKALLVEAAALGCDTFLTIERRLPRVTKMLLKMAPLWIETPASLWAILGPHLRGL